jgi:(p)ppGpp synthase/HD superfamily hydrolase
MKTEKFKNPVETAIWIALNAHEGKLDKAGNPYVMHPLRVAIKLNDEDEIIAAFLHDVVEDSDITINDLKKSGFNDNIIKIVQLMTKNDDDNYDDYISRIKEFAPAVRVKLADLEDNMNLMRIKKPEPEDYKRIEKYKKAYEQLSNNK